MVSFLTRCDACGTLVPSIESVIVRFTRVPAGTRRLEQHKYQVCYKCADPVEWVWRDREERWRKVVGKGVTAEEQRALLASASM